MKIRFLKNVTVDVETRSGDVYCQAFNRWQEVRVDEIYPVGKWEKYATVKLDNGDIAIGVPIDSFEKLVEQKRTVTI